MFLFSRIITVAVKYCLYVASVAGFAMSLIVFFAVVSRYAFSKPFGYTEEIVALCFSTMIFLSIPYLFAMNKNIRVSVFTDSLPERGKRILNYISEAAVVIFFLYMGYVGFDFASTSYSIGARSDIAQIPLTPWMALMPASCFLTAFILVVKMPLESRGMRFGDESDYSGDHFA